VISVTADSNICISGLRSGGRASRLLYLARHGQTRLDISDEILSETISVLREKFGLPGELLHHLSQEIKGFTNGVLPTERLEVIKEDLDDNMILECAKAAGSGFIVSEDKDLLRLKQYDDMRIVRAVDMLALVQRRAGRQEKC